MEWSVEKQQYHKTHKLATVWTKRKFHNTFDAHANLADNFSHELNVTSLNDTTTSRS